MRQSVRRWRIKRIAKLFPQLVPDFSDIYTSSDNPTIVVDMLGAITPLVKGRWRKPKVDTDWSNKWGHMLASAANGGQWPQARKAKIEAWQLPSNLCQLCNEQEGTLKHRHTCKAIKTVCTIKPPTGDALQAELRIGMDRSDLLMTRGMCALRLPAPKFRKAGEFKWILDPTSSALLDTATWYCDGSLLHGKWIAFRTTGFGLVVVSLCVTIMCVDTGAAHRGAMSRCERCQPTVHRVYNSE